MPYVFRDAGGKVKGTSRHPPANAPEEFLRDDAPEVIAYRNPTPPTREEAAEAEIRGSRVLLAMMRFARGDDALTEQQLVDAVKTRLP